MQDIDFLEQQAVDAAISLHWKEAITLNKKIAEIDPQNLATYLRLGFAYLQQNDIQSAKKYYNKALKIQPKSSVALENIERIKVLQEKGGGKNKLGVSSISPAQFIEITGKTKTINLVNPGQKNALAKLIVGQKVILCIKRRKLEIRSQSNEYIGTLPDDISRRLISFIKAKSEYATYIKEANLKNVVIFIKEEFKGKSVSNNVSFPINFQKALEINNQDTTQNTDEEEENENEDWEKLIEGHHEEEKETFVGVQSENLDDEEE